MQLKIGAFFKPNSIESSPRTIDNQFINFDKEDDEVLDFEERQQEISVRYSRRVPNPVRDIGRNDGGLTGVEKDEALNLVDKPLEMMSSIPVRSGDEGDEKVHLTFHKNYTHGIQFNGWINERCVHMPSIDGNRIILVLDGDPPAQTNKVQEVIKMMAIELGDGWIFHKLCKVYLFISSRRIAGCLVAEPIESAFKLKLLSCSNEGKSNTIFVPEKSRTNSTIMRCGNVKFQREVSRRAPSFNGRDRFDGTHTGATLCEKEAVHAICGIRAIWVTPSKRRKRIATHLLDAARKNFHMGAVLEKSQMAFSQPTSAGMVLAFKYNGTGSFLVYNCNTMCN